MSRFHATLLCCLVGACGGGSGGGDDVPDNPDGGLTTDAPEPDAPTGPSWMFADVDGVPNLDDDDRSGVEDWTQAPFATDDDYSTLTLSAEALSLVTPGGEVELTLASGADDVALYRDGQRVLGGATTRYAFTPAGAAIELKVAFRDYAVSAQLVIASGEHTDTVALQAAPLIMNHHLQPAEALWATAIDGNESFIAAYQQALGTMFTAVPGSSVDWDVWMQDEFEFATLTASQGQRMDVVIDSIRNRGLNGLAQDLWVDPGTIAQTWGNPQLRTTYDSFGNLEASPPVTVDGVAYPFGKIYYGRVGSSGMNTTLGTFLASQKVQAPFQLPTSWLCVGHVDEMSSFVPDPSSPKGFKLVISDTNAAWTLLSSLSSSASLPRYGADHGYPTVGSLLNDASLRAVNDDVQADYLDPIVEKFKAELGLTEADIIRLPSLFEQVSGCNGRVAALIPGMVNLIIAKPTGSTTTHLFTADPFFRASGNQADDPVIAAFHALMPDGMTLHFLDNWDVYHLGLGEVHCGTNVRRTPAATWWTDARHLLGGN
ncbi:MAG TPA: protein-arginine deiminase family protein [Kofleriaceae bacterium]|jgi:protein-arginine deiminase|nr:protein-arginine deiminase family protein [Kofleriaceae bacterium]